MEDRKFRIDGRNPLTELSELRFDYSVSEDELSLKCRLILGIMKLCYNKRDYEVGVVHAFLRLNLEGCETTLHPLYGEEVLGEMIEDTSSHIDATLTGTAALSLKSEMNLGAELGASVSASNIQTTRRSQSRKRLPVKALPNSTWEILSLDLNNIGDKPIEGTVIPSAILCRIRLRDGGNRLSILGEVQVSKKALKVMPKGGNRVSKGFSEWQNKDVIVGLILQKAIRREASSSVGGETDSFVAVSRCEISEV